MKKVILTWVYIFFSCCIFAGCGQKEEVQESKEPTIVGSDNNKENSENTLGEKETDNLKENILEEKNDTQEEKTEEVESSDLPLVLLENYKEERITAVPDVQEGSEKYGNIFWEDKNQLEYYTVSSDENGDSLVWKYIWKDGEWQKESVSWLNGLKSEIDQKRITVIVGQDKNEYAWYIKKGEQPCMVKRKGDTFIEITIQDWKITELAKVDVLENGNIVCVGLEKKCSIYDAGNGSLLERFSCGWYKSLCLNGNQVFVLDQENHSVLHYDAAKMEFMPTIRGNLGAEAMLCVEEDQLYACTQKGIYQAEVHGTIFQKILEPGLFHFSKESSAFLGFLAVGKVFYVAYEEEGGMLMKYAQGEQEIVPENTLIIYSLESNDLVIDMIAAFREEYPEVEIIYETGEGGEGSTTVSDRIRALNTRILAGNGPDLLIMDGLPEKSYIEKGILADLNSVLFEEKKELLPNILSAYTKEEKIYMLPMRIKLPLIFTSEQKPEGFVSLKDLAEYSKAQGGGVLGSISCSYCLEMLYCNFMPDIILSDNRMDREAIREFLSLVKELCETEQISETSELSKLNYLGGTNAEWWFAAEKSQILFANIRGISWLSYMPGIAKERSGQMSSSNEMFFPNGLLAVNDRSKRKELALQFVKTMFDEKRQAKGEAEYFPIHQNVLEAQAETDLSIIATDITKEDGSTVTARFFNAKDAAAAVQIVKEVNKPCVVDPVIFEIIKDEAMPYLTGEKSLNESVEGIAASIQLYLYE